jgi:hypothetical protein
MLTSATQDVDRQLLGANLDRLVLSHQFLNCGPVPAALLRDVVAEGMKVKRIRTASDVHSRLADFVSARMQTDPSFCSIFSFLDFSKLRNHQISDIFNTGNFVASAIGIQNYRTIVHSLVDLQVAATKFLAEKKNEMSKFWSDELTRRFDCRSAELRGELESKHKSYSEKVRSLSEEIENLKSAYNALLAQSQQQVHEVEELRKQVVSALHDVSSVSKSDDDIMCLSAGNVLPLLADYIEIEQIHKTEKLRSVFVDGRTQKIARWSSNPDSHEYPSFTVRFSHGIRVRIAKYSLRSGFSPGSHIPYPRCWKLSGKFGENCLLLSEEKYTDALADDGIHEFRCDYQGGIGVNEIRFSMTGVNHLGSSQLHIGYFGIAGDIIGPRSVLAKIGSMTNLLSDAPITSGTNPDPRLTVAEPTDHEEQAGGEIPTLPDGLITECTGLEEVRELSSSRFGSVRLLLRRMANASESELFAAKFYNAGDSREDRSVFMEQMTPFITLNHPSVMAIRGMIAPTMRTGPVVLTSFSECGSLEDVLNRVRKKDPPPFWNNETRTKIIISLITGLEYLHSQGIVHHKLKPSDIIIQPDGTAKICGFLTSYLEEHKFTKANQLGGLFYMAPETYDDDEENNKVRDPKTDVFSFALIAFEIIAIDRVFPASMAAGAIMRKVVSARRDDRPKFPDIVPAALADLMQRCWVPLPSIRPSFSDILHQMNQTQFRFFPDVAFRLSVDIPNSNAADANGPAQNS